MSRPDTHTLVVLLEREEATRDEAKLAYQRALEVRMRAANQLQMLVDYRGDYVARWTQQFRQGGGPEILRAYRDFMVKLDQAIAQQQGALAGTEAQVQRCHGLLVAAETRAAAVRKLIERRDAEHARREEKQARKEMDEIAQRLGGQAARRAGFGAAAASSRTLGEPEGAGEELLRDRLTADSAFATE